MEKVQGVKWCISWEAEFISGVTGKDLSVFCQTSFVELL